MAGAPDPCCQPRTGSCRDCCEMVLGPNCNPQLSLHPRGWGSPPVPGRLSSLPRPQILQTGQRSWAPRALGDGGGGLDTGRGLDASGRHEAHPTNSAATPASPPRWVDSTCPCSRQAPCSPPSPCTLACPLHRLLYMARPHDCSRPCSLLCSLRTCTTCHTHVHSLAHVHVHTHRCTRHTPHMHARTRSPSRHTRACPHKAHVCTHLSLTQLVHEAHAYPSCWVCAYRGCGIWGCRTAQTRCSLRAKFV